VKAFHGDDARRIGVVILIAFPRGGFEARVAVVRSAFPRGDDEDLDVRAPRDGPGGLRHDFDVRAPADSFGGPLLRHLVLPGAANGAAQEERREPRHGAGAAPVARSVWAARVRRDLQEPRHGVHVVCEA